MEIRNKQIITTASGKFDVTGLAGAWVEFDNLQIVNQRDFDPSSQKITFKTVSQPEPSTEQHIPWKYWLLAVVGIGLIIRGIIAIVVTVIENAVQDAVKGQGDLSLTNIPLSSALWAGQTGFNVIETSLEKAIVMRGKATS